MKSICIEGIKSLETTAKGQTAPIIKYVKNIFDNRVFKGSQVLALGDRLHAKDSGYCALVYNAVYLSAVLKEYPTKNQEIPDKFGAELLELAQELAQAADKEKAAKELNLKILFRIEYQEFIFLAKDRLKGQRCVIDGSLKIENAIACAEALYIAGSFGKEIIISSLFKDLLTYVPNEATKEIVSCILFHFLSGALESTTQAKKVINNVTKISPSDINESFTDRKKEFRNNILGPGKCNYDVKVITLIDCIFKLLAIEKRISEERLSYARVSPKIEEFKFWNEYEEYDIVFLHYSKLFHFLRNCFQGGGRTEELMGQYEDLLIKIFQKI